MTRQTVRTLQDKQNVDEVYLVAEKHMGFGKNGRAFLSLTVSDATGSVDAKIWDRAEDLSKEFMTGDFVKIKGAIQVFQNRKQLIIHRLEKVAAETVDSAEFIAQSALNPLDLFNQLLVIINSVKNDFIRQLLQDTVQDEEVKNLMLQAPAAKSIHHAWRGGLLEHIISICKIMDFMGSHYAFLNRDLLLFGAIFHDIGKIYELTFEQSFGYTDRGRLIGHIQIGCELVDKKSARILGFPDELRDICKHIILSHHGKLEYGSPKRPKFLEALVVAMVDDFDSKVSTVNTLLENERASGERWSRYNEMFDRYFLLDDLKTKY